MNGTNYEVPHCLLKVETHNLFPDVISRQRSVVSGEGRWKHTSTSSTSASSTTASGTLRDHALIRASGTALKVGLSNATRVLQELRGIRGHDEVLEAGGGTTK